MTYVYVYINNYIYIHIHTYIYKCIFAKFTHLHAEICIRWIYICAFLRVCIYIYMQSSPHVHIVDYTHMHHIIFNHAHTYRDT